MKQSVRAADDFPGTRTIKRVESAFMEALILSRLPRAKIQLREDGDHLQEICASSASSFWGVAPISFLDRACAISGQN